MIFHGYVSLPEGKTWYKSSTLLGSQIRACHCRGAIGGGHFAEMALALGRKIVGLFNPRLNAMVQVFRDVDCFIEMVDDFYRNLIYCLVVCRFPGFPEKWLLGIIMIIPKILEHSTYLKTPIRKAWL